MATYFISDLHLERIESSKTNIFSQFLNGLDQDDSLYILGDLFESWIGDDNVSELGQFVIDQLNSLSKRAIKVAIMHGNRDFLIGNDFSRASSVELMDDPCIIEIETKKALLTHGDQLCTDDNEYQAFRSVVRNPVWQKDFLNFPISKREKIAGEAKDASKDSKVNKAMEIMDVNEDAVLDAFNDHAVAIMIHGHTHRPNVHRISNDKSNFTRYVLGDWSKESAIILKWDETGIELLDLAQRH
ncbi:MAG: UDP-2,3-diacylglucosamine diphosphatase [Gammaproteobacteria bacterium]|jgi:UDP-2,3-diacylglucosamine hydrolase|nr:UDP-2,3-diacylglucosamine diphosphatase [Gammaproteobacteria bacterium]MDP6146250.1 UDP-2,3-diacylglucosamine diphosphatase [Gammaproteobacteria bacterium]HJL80374.1 UDP-2,3-diacylglucosamine diphosphatase [Gammaproteobacteria bacterium]HJM08753.1 UDP-2,3-diacylglucosamine diphosphatase [Gammaproteobacteria bacterium]HJN00031.1 UDP-2,3-diacylglucosamine diphosphatase [Gammaproteobacteria bacterium]|tara:strand:+ start:566 stop:1294 length:729 start_codon:yes stop_codon:yes gene_type:complete